MRNLIVAAYLAVASGTTVLAQNARPPQSAQQAAEAQNLLIQYSTSYRNSGREGRKLLDAIRVAGLPKTAENVQAVRTLLASNVTADEKVGLAPILGSLYTHDDKTGLNTVIAQDLRGLVYAGPKEVATAAALAFSRLAYFNDSPAVLRYAKDRGYLEDDTYYGELAHMVSYAPPHDQLGLVSEIRSGRNRYATDILAASPMHAEALASMYPETKLALKQCLEENEPNMAKALGAFSGVEAVRYEYWLHALATLSASTNGPSYNDVVFARLNDDKTDPRKIMAFLNSPAGKRFINDVGRKAPFENALQRVTHYSKQFPQNVPMRDAVHEITTAVNLLKA